MKRNTASIKTVQFGSHTFEYALKREHRSDLRVTVRPDLTIEVCAPQEKSDSAVDAKLVSKGAWILRQQLRYETLQPLPYTKRYVSGETFRYLGRQYRLRLRAAAEPHVALKRPFLEVEHRELDNRARIEALVLEWYRSRAIAMLPRYADQVQANYPSLRKGNREVRVRRMRRRWGSCSPQGIITLNPELMQASPACIEYVIVHELCHLQELSHGYRFQRLLSELMPDWPARRKRLNRVL
jgi:predicted metal-dependent hydrolase